MKPKKGAISLVLVLVVIFILVLFGGSIAAYLIGLGGQAEKKTLLFAQETGIAAHILPESYYAVDVFEASRGGVNITVQDPNGTYESDFLQSADGYVVYDNNTQAAVFDVRAFPTAYVAVIIDPNSTMFNDVFWNNTRALSLNFSDIHVAVIPSVNLFAIEDVEFKIPGELTDLDKPTAADKLKPADYWSALNLSKYILPTIPAKKEIGPNFLAVVLVSEGRCDENAGITCAKDALINDALSMSSSTHFYMLRSNCKIPMKSGASKEQNLSNTTLESYDSMLAKAQCYTSANELFTDMITKDLAPISITYEPQHETINPPFLQHNITVKVTKRVGILGAQAAYSGAGSTPKAKMPRY